MTLFNPGRLCLGLLCLMAGSALSAQADLAGLDAAMGQALFERVWVAPPASTAASDGLGPLYNARSCAACHPGGGPGRGSELKPEAQKLPQALVLHLGDHGETSALGGQLQPFAVPGQAAETEDLMLRYEMQAVSLADGEQITLWQPRYDITLSRGLSLPATTRISPRLAPPLAGLAVLDRLSLSTGHNSAGRFGWQATSSDLREQTARALALDMGLGNSQFPDPAGDCSAGQTDCRSLAGQSLTGTEPELADTVLTLLLDYLEALPVPAPTLPVAEDRSAHARGEQVFHALGCAQCHTPAHADGNMMIWPYTDLRVHDLGPGLADRTLAGERLPTAWRTPPLWGLSQRAANSATRYLHDGRAGTLLEAILWHGGEAAAAQQRVLMLSTEEREALLVFLRHL